MTSKRSPVFDSTRFRHANPSPPPDQVRGHASLETTAAQLFVNHLAANAGGGTSEFITHFNLVAAIVDQTETGQGKVMADRDSLKFVGFIFASVTLAVMLTTGMVVKGYADGAYSLETTSSISHTVTLH